MFQITKQSEWWSKQPCCPVWKQCTGKIVNIKCKITGQVLLCCSECLTYFVGTSIPTKTTPCISGHCYDSMLCLDEKENQWKWTEEEITPTWDVDYYFKHVYNPHRSSHATKSITGNNDTNICPRCQNLVKFTYQKDGHGHTYKLKEPRQDCLQLLSIPCTGQKVQYCRFCNSIYPEYRDPTNTYFYGGTLDVYLALLGVIQFCDT